MTYEREVIMLLANCRFLPGSWDKRFARDMAAQAPDKHLSVKQRQSLRMLVNKYRRQLPPLCLAWQRAAQELHPDKLAFEDMLDSDPADGATRLVYADWMDERGDAELATAQRWMVEQSVFPNLSAFSSFRYNPIVPEGIVFYWSFSLLMIGERLKSYAVYFRHPTIKCRSRNLAEMELTRILAGARAAP